MSDDLIAFEHWAGELMAKLAPQNRRALLRELARALRRSQAERIQRQQNPDGTAFEPRKRKRAGKPAARARVGRIRRQAMFAKLRTAKWLKIEVTAEGLAVGFEGRVAKIATVHQEGLRAPVERRGRDYPYPRRVLLGLTDADHDMIRDLLVRHLVA